MTTAEQAAVKFRDEMLAEIRQKFFRHTPEKQWFQERNTLINAIALPASYLHRHGVAGLPSLYREILREVIKTIIKHGAGKSIRRFSFYFLRCVDLHMRHQGDQYYEKAKGTRTVAAFTDQVLRKIQQTEAVQVTETLAQTHRILATRAGRKKRQCAADSMDLFKPCKTPAAAIQKR